MFLDKIKEIISKARVLLKREWRGEFT
jgi:hypothetical protein